MITPDDTKPCRNAEPSVKLNAMDRDYDSSTNSPRTARRRISRSGRFAVAIVIIYAIGLVLWTIATIQPARTFTAGYWCHAKIWADVEEVRTWAAKRKPSADRFEPISPEKWPASLRRMQVSGGRVTCDPKSLTVIFYEGVGYGHWGLTVAPIGTSPPAGRHAIELEDGAWVWHE